MPKSPRLAACEGSKSYVLDVRLFAEWVRAGFGALRILIASPARDANGADDLAVDHAVAQEVSGLLWTIIQVPKRLKGKGHENRWSAACQHSLQRE
jgi:hypothetical protein